MTEESLLAMAAIRHSLQRDVFRPNDERLVGVVHVAKASKKKKASFLCIAVSIEKPVQVSVYQIKKSDKDVYKKKMSWHLHELKLLDGKDADSKETAEFEVIFDRPYKWVASSVQEKNTFISCLWKVCTQYLPRHKPTFVNVPKTILEEVVQTNDSAQPIDSKLESGVPIIDAEDYQALTSREEADLERLMSQSEFAICNAEAFTEQLARELAELDSINIHTIMASEQRVHKLMQILQTAIDEASRLDQRLDAYCSLLKNVGDSVSRMEEKDALIQIQNSNNKKLYDELESIVTQLDLPFECQNTLISGDIKTPEGIANFVTAVKYLQDAMSAQIHPSLLSMTAVVEQKKLFEKLKNSFTTRLSHQLNNLFVHLGNESTETLLNSLQVTNPLTLPVHSNCHGTLTPYTELMHWLKLVDCNSYDLLKNVYIKSLNKKYEREIRWFFEVAKEKISSKYVADKDKKGWSSTSMQEIAAKPIRTRSALLGMDPEHFGSDIDLAERESFDKLLDKILSVLEPICLAEQQFCIKFFGLVSDVPTSTSQTSQLSAAPSNLLSPAQSNISLSRTSSEEILTANPKKDKQINELRPMMAELFSNLEPEIMDFISYYDKVDGFYSTYLLVRLSQHVMSAEDAGSFLSKTFANALVQAKRNFDKFLMMQIKSIEETKVSKKSKCGIIPFVQNFEEFAKQAEVIFKGSDRRADLNRWYIKLVHAMFETIGKIAAEHQKTPQEVVLMENFHHLFTLLYQLKIPCLENERKDAKQKYNEALQAYVTHYFGRPLEKLNLFFEGVESRVAQGVKREEVGYQLAFSKQELRKVIKEYPNKEVKKGLESLYRKVEKHLCEEENLLQVVWHSMQDEFIRQYKYIESSISRCYPGSMITLEFSINDILDFFSDIARSH